MDNKCLELLSRLDKCLQDPEFQLILVMRLIRVFGTLPIFYEKKVRKDDTSDL